MGRGDVKGCWLGHLCVPDSSQFGTVNFTNYPDCIVVSRGVPFGDFQLRRRVVSPHVLAADFDGFVVCHIVVRDIVDHFAEAGVKTVWLLYYSPGHCTPFVL